MDLKSMLNDVPDASPTSSAARWSPKKRRIHEVPSWAQPAKNVRLLTKYTGNTSKARASLSAPALSPAPALLQAPVSQEGDMRSNGPLGYFEKTVYGDIEPQPPATRAVCDWLFVKLFGPESSKVQKDDGVIEIEGKVGTIMDSRTKERLQLPVMAETILAEGFNVTFESAMSTQQHKVYNDLLNQALKESHGDSPPGSTKRRIPMTYSHTYIVDRFYAATDAALAILPPHIRDIIHKGPKHKARVRVTSDQRSGAVLAKVIKARIGDLHIFNPGHVYDFRISVSLEAEWPGDVSELILQSEQRYKDRVSYKHSFCTIDLTQVKAQAQAPGNSATHELEVELDTDALKNQGSLVKNGDPRNQYAEMVQTFLDNARFFITAGGKS